MTCTAHPLPIAAATLPAPAARSLRVLVVEDDPDTRYLVCQMLKAFGHRVRAAGDGERALRLLAAHRFDILFTDVSLPGLSGVELARAARLQQADLNVIFSSGFGPALTARVNFPARALQKPYDIEQLREAIAQSGARVPPTV